MLSFILEKVGVKGLTAGLVGLVLVGLIVAGWFRIESLAADNERLNAQYQAALAANATLQVGLKVERAARKQADDLEVKYHDQTREINSLAADNRRLADELGGLRDPYAPGANAGDSTNAPGCPANSAPSGQLSKEASRFLLELTEEADRMSAYAWTCYRWINRESPDTLAPPE